MHQPLEAAVYIWTVGEASLTEVGCGLTIPQKFTRKKGETNPKHIRLVASGSDRGHQRSQPHFCVPSKRERSVGRKAAPKFPADPGRIRFDRGLGSWIALHGPHIGGRRRHDDRLRWRRETRRDLWSAVPFCASDSRGKDSGRGGRSPDNGSNRRPRTPSGTLCAADAINPSLLDPLRGLRCFHVSTRYQPADGGVSGPGLPRNQDPLRIGKHKCWSTP